MGTDTPNDPINPKTFSEIVSKVPIPPNFRNTIVDSNRPSILGDFFISRMELGNDGYVSRYKYASPIISKDLNISNRIYLNSENKEAYLESADRMAVHQIREKLFGGICKELMELRKWMLDNRLRPRGALDCDEFIHKAIEGVSTIVTRIEHDPIPIVTEKVRYATPGERRADECDGSVGPSAPDRADEGPDSGD